VRAYKDHKPKQRSGRKTENQQTGGEKNGVGGGPGKSGTEKFTLSESQVRGGVEREAKRANRTAKKRT